jgi:hypothetical protein
VSSIFPHNWPPATTIWDLFVDNCTSTQPTFSQRFVVPSAIRFIILWRPNRLIAFVSWLRNAVCLSGNNFARSRTTSGCHKRPLMTAVEEIKGRYQIYMLQEDFGRVNRSVYTSHTHSPTPASSYQWMDMLTIGPAQEIRQSARCKHPLTNV